MNEIKICIKCNIEKNINEFSFRKDTNKYRNECKDCIRKQHKEYWNIEENKIRKLLYMKEYIKKEEYKKARREYQKKFNKTEKRKEYMKIYRKSEKMKNYLKIYSKQYRKTYCKKNTFIEKIKQYNEKNKEHLKEYAKNYRQSQRGIILRNNSHQKRRTIKKQGDVTSEQILNIHEKTKKCYWCGVNLKNVKTHIDHYEPLSKGGKHTISNLVVSCDKCNMKKHDKDPLEFANSIGKLL